jgi:hypothetical protein
MKSRLYNGQRAVCWLIVVLAILALILSACSGTPAPDGSPSISIEPPGPSIDIAPGEITSLVANPQGIETLVTWTATCLKDQYCCPKDSPCKVLNSMTGADNYFTAPTTPGEQVTVRATVKDKYGQESSTALAFKVQSPTPTPEPPTPTPDPPTLLITSPKNGDAVTMTITVTGTMAKPSTTEGTNLYVIVRPYGYDYWVQSPPDINSDGTWKADVGVGQEGDSGLFDICAVLTSQTLTTTHYYPALPNGPAACNTVTRK